MGISKRIGESVKKTHKAEGRLRNIKDIECVPERVGGFGKFFIVRIDGAETKVFSGRMGIVDYADRSWNRHVSDLASNCDGMLSMLGEIDLLKVEARLLNGRLAKVGRGIGN